MQMGEGDTAGQGRRKGSARAGCQGRYEDELRRRNEGSLGSWSKWSGLTDTTSLAVSTLQDLTVLWSPFLFFRTLDPREPLHRVATPGALSPSWEPDCHGAGEVGTRPHVPPTSGEAQPLKWLHTSQLGKKTTHPGRLKVITHVLCEHDHQTLANSVAGHAPKHQQTY